MPVKIRLQRHGKKGKPFYWIVAADSRAKRDGRYLDKLGTYNPNTNPASITLNLEDTLTWLEKGAQPTDTARTLLSYNGVMIKHHLNGGVRKGALTQDEAEEKFTAWLEEKEAKIQAKKDGLSKDESDVRAKRLANEKAVSDKRLADSAVVEAKDEETHAVEDSNEEIRTSKTKETTPIEKETSKEVVEMPTDKASSDEVSTPQVEEKEASSEEVKDKQKAESSNEEEATPEVEKTEVAEDKSALDALASKEVKDDEITPVSEVSSKQTKE
jgi:small subunit ribosomal protein S16